MKLERTRRTVGISRIVDVFVTPEAGFVFCMRNVDSDTTNRVFGNFVDFGVVDERGFTTHRSS